MLTEAVSNRIKRSREQMLETCRGKGVTEPVVNQVIKVFLECMKVGCMDCMDMCVRAWSLSRMALCRLAVDHHPDMIH